MSRRKTAPKITIHVNLPATLHAEITHLLSNPITPGKMRYGAWSALIQTLLESYLEAVEQHAPSIQRQSVDAIARIALRTDDPLENFFPSPNDPIGLDDNP